jgi:hypothetical protein
MKHSKNEDKEEVEGKIDGGKYHQAFLLKICSLTEDPYL